MGKFEKGHPGGPGRPRKTEDQIKFERQCREWASLFAIDRLKRAANGDDIKSSIIATKEILDRGFGKSIETSIIDATVTKESGTSVEDLGREVADLIGVSADKGGAVDSKSQVDK